MKKQDFCFWLQGYFELRESNEYLTYNQINCIKKHIKLVEAIEKRLEGFPAWLMGVLDSYDLMDSGDNTATRKLNEMIKGRLNSVFKHEIDPKYGGDELQETLNKIHKPASGMPTTYCAGGETLRC